MPQPITKIRPPPYTINLGSSATNAVADLSPLVIDALNAASHLDVNYARLAASFTHGRVKQVMDEFLSLRGDVAKAAVVNSLAAASLSDERFSLFKVISSLYEKAMKERHPLAHWLYMSCKEIPDALLLMNPRDWLQEHGLVDPIVTQIRQAYGKPEFQDVLTTSQTQIGQIQFNRLHLIMAYRKVDLEDIAHRLWQAAENINKFHIILGWDAVNGPEGDKHALALSQDPEVAALLK